MKSKDRYGNWDENFSDLTAKEKIKILETENNGLMNEDVNRMDSIAYWEVLDREAQKGLETVGKMFFPLELHAENIGKKLREKKKELENNIFLLGILRDPPKEVA